MLCVGWDGWNEWMVIIGHRCSKSTFVANDYHQYHHHDQWAGPLDFLLNNEFAASVGFFSARQTWSAICQPQNIRETTKNKKI